jgi:hypothetical protein
MPNKRKLPSPQNVQRRKPHKAESFDIPPPFPDLDENIRNRLEREGWFDLRNIIERNRGNPIEGNYLPYDSSEGFYSVNLGTETLEKLFKITDIQGGKVADLIREAVAFWLESRNDKTKSSL